MEVGLVGLGRPRQALTSGDYELNPKESRDPGGNNTIDPLPKIRRQESGAGKAAFGDCLDQSISGRLDHLARRRPVEKSQVSIIHDPPGGIAKPPAQERYSLAPQQHVGESDNKQPIYLEVRAKLREKSSGIAEVL